MLTTIVIAPSPNVTPSPAIWRRERTSFDSNGKGRINIRTSEIMFMIQSTSNSFVSQKVHLALGTKFCGTSVPHQKMARSGAAMENERVMAAQT
jgi:hypothetical protein